MNRHYIFGIIAFLGLQTTSIDAKVTCDAAGPQAPRDLLNGEGSNPQVFTVAPPYQSMNLCNIHTHTNAEHKGPGFSIKKGEGNFDGYLCNETASLTEAELKDPCITDKPYGQVKPGDTIEVHWVHTSCDTKPGKGLGSCVTEGCENPKLRVESQVFLLVNDEYALDFMDYIEEKQKVNGFYQAKSLPQDTGKPITYLGSTTGMYVNEEVCSPAEVTWSVRPMCAKLNIKSLYKWAAQGNVYEETASHAVRQRVTNKSLLSPIHDVKSQHASTCVEEKK